MRSTFNDLILLFTEEMLDKGLPPGWQTKTVDQLSKELHATKDPVEVALLAITVWASKDQISPPQGP